MTLDMAIDTDILFWGLLEIKIIKHGSVNVTKVPKLCVEICPTERLLKCCFSTMRVKWFKFTIHNTKVSLLNAM